MEQLTCPSVTKADTDIFAEYLGAGARFEPATYTS